MYVIYWNLVSLKRATLITSILKYISFEDLWRILKRKYYTRILFYINERSKDPSRQGLILLLLGFGSYQNSIKQLLRKYYVSIKQLLKKYYV